MAVDLRGQRLFVAALENDTLEVIDLKSGERTDEIKGLKEPQGVAYVPETDKLLVSNGEGASLDIYDGSSLELIKEVKLSDDPDNVRYDPTGYAYVGYGSGGNSALGVVDVEKGTKVADIKLSGHPESFQLESEGRRIFVNVPTSGRVEVVDREKDAVVETWTVEGNAQNFPMALDETNSRLFVGTRSPAKLLVLDTSSSGKTIATLDSSGDADDVFYDAKSERIYVSGGEGAESVFAQVEPDHYEPAGKADTAEGARTSLFVDETGTLYVAVPHRGDQQAEVRALEAGSGK